MRSQRRRRRRSSRGAASFSAGDNWILGGVIGLTVLSMLFVGSVHAPIVLGLSLLSLPLGTYALYRLYSERVFPRGNPVWALFGLAVFCVVQALPLPDTLTRRLSPHVQDVWADSLRPFGELVPAWHSLSLDAGATWLEANKWFSYCALFSGALFISVRGQALWLWLCLLGSATLAALVSAAHLAVGATRLYGIYEPQLAVTPWRVAPLLNPNNLSGYLLLGLFAGFAVLFSRRPPLPRLVLLVPMAGVLGVLILTGSRGGVAALALGLVLFLGFLLLAKRASNRLVPSLPRWAAVTTVAVVAGSGVCFALLAASEQTRVALQDESFSKLSVARWALGMVGDNWLWGVGRGAFETAFPPYRAGLGRMLFQYPENFVVQWLTEWGVVATLLATLWLLKTMRPWRYFTGSTSTAALAIGGLALLAQNLVDLGLEVMSIGIAFSVALGTLCGSVARRDRGGNDEGSRPDASLGPVSALSWGRDLWLAAPVSLALLANGLGWSHGLHSALSDRREMRAAYDELAHDKSKTAGFREQLHAAILRHPGDAYLPLLGALAARREGHDPVVWINRALERDPERGATHFVLARVLLERGSTGQAMLALKFAVERQPEFLNRAAALAQTRARSFEQVMASVPDGVAGVPMLLALALTADRNKAPAVVPSAGLIDEAVRRDPQSLPARQAEVKSLLAEIKAGSGRCAGENRAACFSRVDVALRALERNAKEPKAEIVLAQAERRALDGRVAEADQYLAEHCPELTVPTSCLRERVLYALSHGNAKASGDAATAYLAAACDSAAACAKASLWVGDRMQEHGDALGALAYYSRAAKDRPDPAVWRKVAAASKAAGQPVPHVQESQRRAEMGQPGTP